MKFTLALDSDPISQDLLSAFLLIRGRAIIGWFHQRPEHDGSDYFADVKTGLSGSANPTKEQSDAIVIAPFDLTGFCR